MLFIAIVVAFVVLKCVRCGVSVRVVPGQVLVYLFVTVVRWCSCCVLKISLSHTEGKTKVHGYNTTFQILYEGQISQTQRHEDLVRRSEDGDGGLQD